MKTSLFSMLLCFIILCGCSPANTAIASPSPTATATHTPTPTPVPTAASTAVPTAASTAMPTVLPLPSGNLPGWYKDQSILWSGYSSPMGGVLGVRAQWIEPQVSGGPNSNVYIWIGVGGWAQTLNELIQIGTLAYTDTNGETVHRVWYETVPQLSQLTSMFVSAGDKIGAVMELDPGSNQNWNLSLHDMTQSTSFATRINYPSHQVYADFMVEDPHSNSTDLSAPLYPFQQFTSVSFSAAQVHYANGWYSIAALLMIQITMIQKGKIVAYPGDITAPDSFFIIHA